MDEVELQLVKIWESVLGRRDVGTRQNFWDLGGHSLVAIQMMRRIERVIGKQLPISTLLYVPTIEDLAKLLKQSGWRPNWSSLIPIQPYGKGAPFFCVHGIGGIAVGFRRLAHHLGADRPFYGLQAQGMDGKQPILTRVEDMAAHYIKEIRMLEPHGPYYLGGLSFGGWIAYEMAQQLQAQGEEVSMVAFFGTYRKTFSRKELFRKLLGLRVDKSLAYGVHKTGVYLANIKTIMNFQLLPPALKKVRASLHRASAAYVPEPYPGTVTLFRPVERSIRESNDPVGEWSGLAAQMNIIDVPGNHDNILDEPQVGVLAALLRNILNRCEQREPRDSHTEARKA